MGENAFDILILGAGPAGISAALTAHARGRSAAILSADPMTAPLAKAHRIDNYPGLAASGRDMLSAMAGELARQDIEAFPQVTVRFQAYDSASYLCTVNGGEHYLVARTTGENAKNEALEFLVQLPEE